ncbi:hypothetical protein GOBAR_AA25116 [Gossypium barbadense]|uniref:Uncharacterized protein n=1 Tax=Gossypium barbadense TaxID=3634 RepID=A0A2P5WWU1_GOSBA|nr:hypothetical protein GOBAR_AA25116 [Gossypium barbadense]
MSLKEAHESFSSNSRGPVREDQRLQIGEIDEWQTHKQRTHGEPKLRQDGLNTFSNQLKVGDRVFLDAADPRIVTTTPNEEIPLTVLSIFPFGTVEVSHPKFDTFKVFHRDAAKSMVTMPSSRGKKAAIPASKKKKGASSSSGPTVKELFFGIIEPTYLEITMELCSTFHLQTVMTNYDDPGTVQFSLGGLFRQLSVPEFGVTLGLYMEEFKEENDLHALNRHIHRSPSRCWDALVLGRQESTGVVNTHDAYFLWCMSHGHVIDLAYFIALAIQHQTEWHRKGVISIGPYVTRLARHFGLLSTAAQKSPLTFIGKMSPQGILSMLSIRMIEKCRGTYPSQYRLAQSTKDEAYEDIPNDVPPQHEGLPTQPPPPSRPIHTTASYANISESLTRFEQHCFQ